MQVVGTGKIGKVFKNFLVFGLFHIRPHLLPIRNGIALHVVAIAGRQVAFFVHARHGRRHVQIAHRGEFAELRGGNKRIVFTRDHLLYQGRNKGKDAAFFRLQFAQHGIVQTQHHLRIARFGIYGLHEFFYRIGPLVPISIRKTHAQIFAQNRVAQQKRQARFGMSIGIVRTFPTQDMTRPFGQHAFELHFGSPLPYFVAIN